MVVQCSMSHISKLHSLPRTERRWRALTRAGFGVLVALGCAATSAAVAPGAAASSAKVAAALPSAPAVPAKTPTAPSTTAPATTPAVTPLTAALVIQFLDQTIDWYHGLTEQQQLATTPSDLAILYDNRQYATQVIRIAFDFARAEAAFIAADSTAGQGQNAVLSQYQSLNQLQTRLDKQVKDTQAELDADRQKLATAGAKQREELQSQISELQGELDLAGARHDAIHSMLDFVSGSSTNGLGASGLRAQIETLARSVPAAAQSPAAASAVGA